jgi:predicted DCC family thiol-disulfide oxidoreductase YuxK
VLAWDRNGTVRPVAIQSDEGQRLLASVPETERLDSWHLVGTDGELRSGGRAAAPLVSELPAGRALAAVFRTFPRTTDRAYRFVAGHREWFARRLGIDATCQLRR